MKNDITEEDAKKIDERITKEYPDKKPVNLIGILKKIVKPKPPSKPKNKKNG